MGKGEIASFTSNFFFSHGVFKRLVLQTHKIQGLFGKRLINIAFHFINLKQACLCRTFCCEIKRNKGLLLLITVVSRRLLKIL